MRHTNLALAMLAGAVLAACGGSSSDSGPVIDNSLARGSLVANPPNMVPIPQADGTAVKSLEPAVFAAMLEAAKPGTTQVTGTPKCAITNYYMKYGTVGGKGEATDATGAIMVPSGSDPACSGARPVLLYAHGTTVEKKFNMANIRDNSEASLVAAMFAAQGFIVVAPNYAGYDVSSLKYHPYINAEQQANDMVDALRAARKAFPNIGATDSGKLLITGYSQGGHVALATQRAMQLNYASEFKVTAVAGLSGPYAMSLFSDAIMAGSPNLGGTLFMPLLTSSWQNSYGNIYTNPNEVFESNFLAGIETLLPGDLTTTELFTSGKLPQAALFNSASLPGPSSPAFAPFFGANNLVKTSFRNAFLADAQAHPCNVNPADPLNCAPANGTRIAAKKNDLRTYVPTVPVMMCGGNGDPTVFWVNSQATAGFFMAKGLPAAALTVLDVDSAPTGATDPFAAAKVGFAQTKAAAINAAIAAHVDPAVAVGSAYHGSLVPPFCQAAARGFFQNVLAH
jgi:acetyl esterase/lipase